MATSGNSAEQQKRLLVWGSCGVDMIVHLPCFPQPDDKIRADQTVFCGGGNAGNTAIALARLGMKISLITKFGNDSNANLLQNEFRGEGVDISSSLHSQTSISPFTYVMVHGSSRTCIHSPMIDDITHDETLGLTSSIDLSLYQIIHYDSRHTLSAGQYACVVRQTSPHILQSIDLEKPRPHIEELLREMNLIFTNKRALNKLFPSKAEAEEEHEEERLISQMQNFFERYDASLTPNCQLVVCTLGERGSILLCPKRSPFLSPTHQQHLPWFGGTPSSLPTPLPIVTFRDVHERFVLLR
jgi:sugar/nucleoside kinase (ribokinase family)